MKVNYLTKSIPIVLLWVSLCLPWVAGAQTGSVITVGDTNRKFVPYVDWNLPFFKYGPSYIQQLVLSSELNGPAIITGIDFYSSDESYWGRPGLTLYMANTYVQDMDGGFVPFGATFQLVSSNSLSCTTGWNHYNLDTPFFYNGLGNLILAADSPFNNAASGGRFYCDSIQHMVRQIHCRRDSITASNHDYGMPWRNIMRLYTQPLPATAATCPAPTLWADSIGSTAVKLRWSQSSSSSSWVVECITDGDTGWHSSGPLTSDTTYTMTGLLPNTHYTFRLTTYCTDTFTTVLKHILTNCTPTLVLHFEGFQSSWDIPGCWYTTPGATGQHPEVTASSGHLSSRGVKMQGGNIVLPVFDARPDSLQLSFWVNNTSDSIDLYKADLYVGMITDPLDTSTFVIIDTVSVRRDEGWKHAMVLFGSYPNATGRIAIFSSSPNITDIDIDDIEVNRICHPILTVRINHVTDTSALVHWVADEGDYYQVAYGLTGIAADSASIVTGIYSDTLHLGGLLPYTLYDVYVRTHCGVGYSEWSQVRTFRTYCAPLDTLPFTDDFNRFTTFPYPSPTELPCWRGRLDPRTTVCPIGGRFGSSSIRWWWRYADTTANPHVILPVINPSIYPVDTLQLSFWAENWSAAIPDAFGYDANEDARLLVGVMTDPEVDSTFQLVDTVHIIGTECRRYDVPLVGYTGTGRFITIKSCPGTGAYSCWVAYIDDVTIDIAPPCSRVTGIALTALTSNSATVRWDSRDSAAVWQTHIDTVATTTPVADTTVCLTPFCTLDGLTSETPYYFWVRSICPSGDTSAWEGPLQIVPGIWNMRSNRHDTLSMCGVTIYDGSLPISNYTRVNSSLVILPAEPNTLVVLNGNISSNIPLKVYDGIGTSGRVLWTNDGYTLPHTFGPVVSASGPATLVINDAMVSPSAIGSFEFNVTCIPDSGVVKNLRLDPSVPPSDTLLALTWDCNGASHYQVEYGAKDFVLGSGISATATTNSYTIGGLASLERRDVYVRCIGTDGDTGDWVHRTFQTAPCPDAVYRENFDSTMYYESEVNDLPIGSNFYRYSYVQTLIDSAHLAGLEGGITALAFHPSNYSAADHMNRITVYLANVSDTSLADGPIVPDAGHRFVQVVDSADYSHSFTTDWQLYSFDHPFLWDGHKNLLVAVKCDNGSLGSYVKYYGHRRRDNLAPAQAYIIYSNDTAGIDIDSARHYTPASSSYTPGGYSSLTTGDLRLYTNTCALPLCVRPVIDTVWGDHESLTIVWSGVGNSYQLALDGADPIPATGGSHTFTTLQPATTYRVSLRQNCSADSLGYSDWVTVDFTTDSFTCPAPDSLTVSDITHNSATFDWAAGEDDTQWQLEIWTPGNRHVTYFPTGHPLTVEGLMPGTEYCAYVHGYCGSEHQIPGEWSDSVCFSTLVCPMVTGLDTTDITAHSVTLTWDAVEEGQDYLVQYGPAGFVPTEGADSVVPGNGCVIVGLSPSTAYDFYVRTRCAEDWLSSGYRSIRNVVTLGDVGIRAVEQPFQFTLSPNPAKEVTTVMIEGLPSELTGVLHVTVADLTGRDVLSRDIQCDGHCKVNLDIEGLPAGAYFVRVVGEKGSAVRKLIVK